MSRNFRVLVSRDFLRPDGSLGTDMGLGLLEGEPRIAWEFLREKTGELRADQLRDFDALLLLGGRLTAASLRDVRRLSVVARFGVGYDNVDVEACTREGVALTITPDGVRRPVASAAVAFLLALSHRLLIKDRLTRAGRWADKLDFMGTGLIGQTLGVIGLGNIGREVLRLIEPFEMRHLAHDPYVTQEDVQDIRVELVDLERLLRDADFVCISCALTSETRQLISADRLSLMKPTAYLVNVARGPVVDQRALTKHLREGRIQGAALDVFETEPVDPGDPLLELENVIVAPHALSWTDECFREIGKSACRSILDVAAGRVPQHVVNKDVLDAPAFREKLRAHALEAEGAA